MEFKEFVKSKAVLKVGQRVEIAMNDERYTSRVEDFNETDLVLAMPLDEKRRPIIPYTGEKVDVCVFGEQCGYRFLAEYKDKAASPIPVWIVALPEKAEKKQNRKFVRVKVSIPIYIQIPDEEGGMRPRRLTQTVDISGSGFLFLSEEKIHLSTKIVLETEVLPQIGRIKTFAEVVRCSKPVADRNLYWIGVKFLDFPRGLQNKLVQFVFQKQREQLAKRLK